jgi:hypothetical protein
MQLKDIIFISAYFLYQTIALNNVTFLLVLLFFLSANEKQMRAHTYQNDPLNVDSPFPQIKNGPN